ncbi:MAG: hypothetical protein HN995_13625 [Candidatus Marinimicrobia bacterium]|jgi:hypothetical protein|nr:hypothetical protein [Candidatus Neomarinimicrobiota bacterium]MBT4295402.1 hypothetical protein [Candidatus Neomarinimicrobiota bacterium]MBT4994351.1 hypothetical protein [Candidatus Neomarinimicrobiota bacterium]MBT6948214.1 hypothetical protein [Candidatus Neomarinimicrobiota bacterium]
MKINNTNLRYLIASIMSVVAYVIPIIFGTVSAYLLVTIASVIPKIGPLCTLLSVGIMWVSGATLAPIASIFVFSKIAKTEKLLPNLLVAALWSILTVTSYALGFFAGDHGIFYNLVHLNISILIFFVTAILFQKENSFAVQQINRYAAQTFNSCLILGIFVHMWTVYNAFSRDGLISAFFAFCIPVGAETWYLLEIWSEMNNLDLYTATVVLLCIPLYLSFMVKKYSE